MCWITSVWCSSVPNNFLRILRCLIYAFFHLLYAHFFVSALFSRLYWEESGEKWYAAYAKENGGALFHNVSGKSCYYHVSFNSTVLGLTGFPKHVKWTIFSNNLIMYIFRNKSIIWCFFGFWHYKNSCLRFSKLRGKRLKKYNEKSRMRLDMSYRVQKLSGM